MHGSGWSDAGVVADPSRPGRYEGHIADRWNLAVVPQGGIVAVLAARAMAEELGHDEQPLRTFTAVFAGQVALGPVEIDVTVLRRGRTMSQLSATVRNPGAKAGLTAIAVFGAEREGFAFTDLEMPDVPRSRRGPVVPRRPAARGARGVPARPAAVLGAGRRGQAGDRPPAVGGLRAGHLGAGDVAAARRPAAAARRPARPGRLPRPLRT